MPTSAIVSSITPESVAAAAVTFDAQDRAVVGDVVLTLGEASVLLPLLAPREWEQLAAYLLALVDREPVKTSPAYAGHRVILGAIAHELRTYARIAGEPVGLEADLRAATSKAEERRIRERIADQEAAAERRLDDIALATAAQMRHDPEHHEEVPAEQPTPPPIAEVRDDAWLL